MSISYEMRRVLKIIRKKQRATPEDCRCGYRTFMALERRNLISVNTSFNSIAFPRKAEAVITDDGLAALNQETGR